MSDVLIARIRACLADYDVQPTAVLDLDELASEILLYVLPSNDDDCDDEPIFRQLICDLGVCTNCYTEDCACCRGCGGINADIGGSHGYWCGF